jgi:hypothetical protein
MIRKPSECEVGKIYRIEASSSREVFRPGTLVIVTSVDSDGCSVHLLEGTPVFPMYDIYSPSWDARGVMVPGELLMGPVTDEKKAGSISDGQICPDCGCAMEWVSLAMKCPKCWKIM